MQATFWPQGAYTIVDIVSYQDDVSKLLYSIINFLTAADITPAVLIIFKFFNKISCRNKIYELILFITQYNKYNPLYQISYVHKLESILNE